MVCGGTHTAKADSLVAKMKALLAIGRDVALGQGTVNVDDVLEILDGDQFNVPTFDTSKLRNSINRDGYRGQYSNVHRARRVRQPYVDPYDPNGPDMTDPDYFDSKANPFSPWA